MKTLALFASLLLASGAAQATSIQQSNANRAEIAFESDVAVANALKEAKLAGLKENGTKLIELSGQCGFAGCASFFLVSTSLKSKSINETTDSVSAVVQVNPIGATSVHMIKNSSLLVDLAENN